MSNCFVAGVDFTTDFTNNTGEMTNVLIVSRFG